MQKQTQCNRILQALRGAPNGITSRDMINMNIFKYSSRIAELRAKGHKVVAHRVHKSLWRYTLEDQPTTREVEELAGEFVPIPQGRPKQETLIDIPIRRRYVRH